MTALGVLFIALAFVVEQIWGEPIYYYKWIEFCVKLLFQIGGCLVFFGLVGWLWRYMP